MVKPHLIGEMVVPISEVKAELLNIKERDGELNFRAKKCEEYLNDFSSLPLKKAAELTKKIGELGIARLKDEQIVPILDLLPVTPEEVKVLFQGNSTRISKKDMESIATLVKGFAE